MMGLEEIKEANLPKQKIYAVFYGENFVQAFTDKTKAHENAKEMRDLGGYDWHPLSVRAFISV